MKRTYRTLMIAALFVSLLIVSVAFHSGRGGTRVGDHAPALSFNSEPTDALRALRGKYVLLSFWSATNAPSRDAVYRYTNWLERQPNSDIGLLAFNLDKSETLFRETVKRDGLNQQLQFRLDERRTADLMRDYGLQPGTYGTLLIAPDGKILAHNPDIDAIRSYVK